MRKLIAAMKVSLDGKFQGPEGYADWVNGWSDDYDLLPQIDACLLGGQMYGGYERYWSAMRHDENSPSPMTGTLPTKGELTWSRAIPDLPHFCDLYDSDGGTVAEHAHRSKFPGHSRSEVS